MRLQQNSPKGAHAPNEATLQTNSSLKLGRWMHAYGELLRYVVVALTRHPSSLCSCLVRAGPTFVYASWGAKCNKVVLLCLAQVEQYIQCSEQHEIVAQPGRPLCRCCGQEQEQ